MHRHRPDRALGRIRAHGTYRADRPHGARGHRRTSRPHWSDRRSRHHRADRPGGRRQRGGTHGAYRRYRESSAEPP